MRTNLIFFLVLALGLAALTPGLAAPSLGGLSCSDNLITLDKSLGVPDMVRAHRTADPTQDFAAFIWQKPALTVVTLTAYGDKLDTVLTESPSLTTNDGIKVGDPVSSVVTKLGKPEETGHEMAGITEYWYWSQGINFGIDDSKQAVSNIFVFPAGKPQAQGQSQDQSMGEMQHLLLPGRNVDVQHRYMTSDGKTYIAGTVHNKAAGPLSNVRLGLTLMDKNGRVVKTVPVDAGSIARNQSKSFQAAVPPMGDWASCRVDVQAADTSAGKSRPAQMKYALIR